tara:strand:- start:10255 stop:10671 length:417 start_codon:yes stop_codon:yes gene_type:complete
VQKTFEKNFAAMKDLLREFTSSFKNGGRSIQWLQTPRCQIYVRARYINSRTELCLASIDIEERLQGRGMLTQLITFIETELEFDVILVESVLSSRLSSYLERTGFELTYQSIELGRSFVARSVTAVKKLSSNQIIPDC